MSTEKHENSIYRAEALQHKQEGWLGVSYLDIPSSLSICILTGMLTVAFIVSIIIFGSYSERVNATGNVIYDPPAVSLIAQSNGIIINSVASEKKLIKQGEVIFSVSDETETNLGATKFEIEESLKKQQNILLKKMNIITTEADENKTYFIERIKNKEQEINGLNILIKNSEEQRKWFEKKSGLYEQLRKKGLARDSEFIDRKKDYYSAIVNLSSARVKIITLQGELLDLKNKISATDRESDSAKKLITAEIAGIKQKILNIERQREYLIVAPFNGKITSVTAHKGERVKAGQQVAVIVPLAARPKIELLSSSDSLGEVADGQQVKMRIAAYPYQWYGKVAGVIDTISEAPVNIPPSTQTNSEGKALFRITVRPVMTEQQKSLSLLPGMKVETEIYVRTRKNYEWLFMPVKRVYERICDNTQ
ncbi:HlyD family efflux transporter periplasmic adaptor subunit [Xenorhabdus sp. PB61.4]|uniref:HlyD family secretion protein n=1 Tax=Xenorhabdus sp. PB61.4 TaxID=2788940 RepID=UPI001E42AF8C|nr:HlyD family efflux transporter periplasmic adaptor subunit [Xenorhabdus sp. PB61.4]MCC8365292.1 HlyD family efflux transporter periplasmic adaptor subunit [Xenorhabdus sp. PB61.4]